MTDKIPEGVVAEPSMTIDEFCLAERMSRASFFKMKNLGYAPDTITVPGTRIIRISADARRAWQRKMSEMQANAQAKRERQLRSDAARRAGERAAASPRHFSKTRQRRTAKRRA